LVYETNNLLIDLDCNITFNNGDIVQFDGFLNLSIKINGNLKRSSKYLEFVNKDEKWWFPYELKNIEEIKAILWLLHDTWYIESYPQLIKDLVEWYEWEYYEELEYHKIES
jgi:hypothetical protein